MGGFFGCLWKKVSYMLDEKIELRVIGHPSSRKSKPNYHRPLGILPLISGSYYLMDGTLITLEIRKLEPGGRLIRLQAWEDGEPLDIKNKPYLRSLREGIEADFVMRSSISVPVTNTKTLIINKQN